MLSSVSYLYLLKYRAIPKFIPTFAFSTRFSSSCILRITQHNTHQPTIKHPAPGAMSGLKRSNDEPKLHAKNGRPAKRKRGQQVSPLEKQRLEGSADEVLFQDIKLLLGETAIDSHKPVELKPPELFSQIELCITMLSSTGDGLAVPVDGHRVFVVPFTVPGDTVIAKVVRNYEYHTITDLVQVKARSTDRDDDLVFCKYFGRCSGCQFQMLPYTYQIDHKRKVIEKALKNFSTLDQESIPPVGEIMQSPLTRGYRTKLTPHFDGPRRGGFGDNHPTPDIGFQVKGRNFVLDIEDCPIGTNAVREGMKEQREYVKNNLQTFKRGATILLRETTERIPSLDREELPRYKEVKACITDSKAMSTEWIGPYKFCSPAGAFFQNNNSILVNFTKFVRECLEIPATPFTAAGISDSYLIDAYCGSGLFSICCGSNFKATLGVDISHQSVESARVNAEQNGIANARFITGKAEAIFADVTFPPNRTSIVIDPPRKGCDEVFLTQLINLAPKRIVYISCNVHTMARDIGWLSQHNLRRYKIDRVGGFDFFPQTHHVEGYAILTLSDQPLGFVQNASDPELVI